MSMPDTPTTPDAATTFDSAIDGAMSDAFDKMNEQEIQPEAVPAPAETPAEAGAEQTEGTDEDTPKDGAETVASQDDPDHPDGQENEPGEDEASKTDDNSDPLEAPARWSAEDKAEFAALPRQAQDLMLRRERQRDAVLTESLQQHSEQRKQYGELDKVLSPLASHLQVNGMSPATYVARLAAAEQQIIANPIEGLKQVAQMFGAPPPYEAGNGVDPGAGEYVDPMVAKLQTELTTIKQSLAAQQQNQTQAVRSEVEQSLEAFKAQPGHEHFETLRQDMARLIQSGMAKDFSEAYEKAERLNPEIAAQKAATVAETQRKKDLANAKAKAAKADKAAGTSPQSRTPEAGQETVKRSIDETMDAKFQELQAT